MNETRQSFLLEPSETSLPTALAFLRQARFNLREHHLVKITISLASLRDEQIWQRPNESSNSIGNLVLHLAGNIRQWIIAGVGGAIDVRARVSEFAAREGLGNPALTQLLQSTLAEVDAVLAALEKDVRTSASDAPLQRLCQPQGFPQTVFDALSHVLEHFSYHTGQIVFLAKWLTDGNLCFSDDNRLNTARSTPIAVLASSESRV